MNDMGCSSLLAYFYVRTATSDEFEAKVYKMKSLLKSGLWRDGASAMAYFILLKAFFSSVFHLKITLFLIIPCKGLTIWAKSNMNLCTKLIFPRKDCMALLLLGGGIWAMTLARSRYTTIPFLVMIWPSKFPSDTVKTLFFGLNEIPYFLHL